MPSKHRLTSGQWLALFAATVVLLGLLLAGFNLVTDPFGAFGDRFFTWWSYDETNNPRLAKMSYLDRHHDQYDSYIIGCSSTSSFPTEDLEKTFGGSFYNLIMYGADMLDVEQMSRYLIEHYEVKTLVVNVYLDNGITYDDVYQKMSYTMPWWVSGDSRWEFYKTYLFADPRYGWDKLKKLRTDGYVQREYDVFNEETGAYDKSLRDVEPIGALGPYLETYPEFVNYDLTPHELPNTAACMESLAAIRDLCAQAGVRFEVVTAPVYYDYLTTFPRDQVEDFYAALAEVTPFWDFSVSSVSREPRYFYDATHFRNDVGRMALARIAGDESVYIPADLGVYVTPENVRAHVATFWQVPPPDERGYTRTVPVLMYHDLAPEGDWGDTVSVAAFADQLRALSQAGYTAVDFYDLRAYVLRGTPLPEKPVVITFDDGYDSNRTLALPLLREYGMKATVFAIGVSAGKDTYKDTGEPMTPHFSWAQAAEMEASGVFTVRSHGYDVHQVEGRDPDPIRPGALRKEGEREEDYIAFLRADCEKMEELLAPLGHGAEVFAWPYGYSDDLSAVLLSQAGIWSTVTTREPGLNTLVAGLPQSLYGLDRYYVTDYYTGDELVELLAQP